MGITFIAHAFFLSMLILGEFTSSYPKRVLGASLLALSPVFLQRAFLHASLSAQWILLAAIWFIILEYRQKLWRWSWLLLFAFTILIHLYFVAMLVPLLGISLFFRYRRKKEYWKLAIDLLSIAGVILVLGHCLGLFDLSLSSLQESGFGYYSWNINGFLNPFNSSSIINQIPTNPDGGQNEGFSYLGLGNLLLLLIGLIFFLQRDYSKEIMSFFLPFVIVSILLAIFALSNKAFLNSQLLYYIHLPDQILKVVSMFRSSGRFIWPVFYFIVLFGLVATIRNIRFSTPILILAIILQLIDIQPLFSLKKQTRFDLYQSPLQAEFWQSAAEVNDHIIVLPTSGTPASLNSISIYSSKNNMTLNWGYFSRVDATSIREYSQQIWKELQEGISDPKTIYIFWDKEMIDIVDETLEGSMVICLIDGYKIAFSPENKILNNGLDLSILCNLP